MRARALLPVSSEAEQIWLEHGDWSPPRSKMRAANSDEASEVIGGHHE